MKFSSANEALQHLADITGKRVKIANDILKGGMADEETIESIAKKHDVSIEVIKDQLKKGIKIEYEHTDDEKLAAEISLDHLTEFPDYYDRLEKMEQEAEDEVL